MDDRQENRQGSHRTTGQVLTDNATIFAAVPAMVTEHQNLLDSVALADGLAASQGVDNTGIALGKKEFLRQMKVFTLRVAGALTYYASVNNDLTLKGQAHIVDSSFAVRDDEKDDVAQGIYDLAMPLVASLADAGVTATTMTAFQTRIEAYRLSIAKPAAARAATHSFTSLLDVEIRRADMICQDRLDGLMEQFRFQPDGTTETAFYIAYHAAREIIDTGSHKKKATTATP